VATQYRTVDIDGLSIFFREAGAEHERTLVLLPGFPSSSHQYRELIPLLADHLHVVALDYPGFGYSDSPPVSQFRYTFDRLAEVTERFLGTIGVDRFALYVFDFGAPIGYRIAAAHPERIDGLVIQNGNAYAEGLGPMMDVQKQFWSDRDGTEPRIRDLLTLEVTRAQYTDGAGDRSRLSPDAWTLDQHFLDLPGRKDVMVELLYDYQSNTARYPEWQTYFREHQPPALIVWGARDQFFTADGARAYLNDLPDAELHLLDAGHFALEEHTALIADRIRAFLGATETTTR
jgi:pimeloyl-ACP methyl ester carboxylesterase